LIEAAAMLRRQHVPIFVVVAGNGPDRDALATSASRLGITDAVLFLGYTPDMPAFYSALDAFALCSRTESFGLVLAEAHACERAVIATPTAGAATQIAHHIDGVLLKSFTVTELVEALHELYRKPSWRDQLGRQGRVCVFNCFSRASELTCAPNCRRPTLP
jgi:glycosyltransferase involved in cell wall biosynthesis